MILERVEIFHQSPLMLTEKRVEREKKWEKEGCLRVEMRKVKEK